MNRLTDEGKPAATDSFGDGNFRVYAIGAQPGKYMTVLTAIIARPADFAGSGPLRVVEVLTWRFESTQWEAVGMLSAFVVAEQLLQPGPDINMYVPGWEKLGP